MVELVVIGNGFDRHHGLLTAYSSFAEFAKIKSPTTYAALSKLFLASADYMGLDQPSPAEEDDFSYDRWCDFESCLGLLDDEEFGQHARENVSEYMQELGMEEYIVDDFIQNITSILDIFREWVAQIKLPLAHRRNFCFAHDTAFINFNYTETLEDFYGVDRTRILYIHGRRATTDKLIVGHDISPPEPQSKHDLPDYRNNPFYGYLRLTRKPVATIVPKLQKWLNGFPGIEKISVRGHSLALVDLPYFDVLAALYPKAKWSFSYHTNDAFEDISCVMERLGIGESTISSIATLSELEIDPNTQSNALTAQLNFQRLFLGESER